MTQSRIRFLLVLALVACSFSAFGDDRVYVGTPTSDVYGSSNDFGLGANTNVVNVTASSTALTNAFASLPSDDYDGVLIQAASGTVYVNGTTATPTLGMSLTTSMPPIYLTLPMLPKSTGKCWIVCSSVNAVLRMIPVKLRKF